MERFYVFGLQRSGTNYLEQLIRKNFKARPINNGQKCWKHSLEVPKTLDKQVPMVHIYKNPYMWIESLATRNKVDYEIRQKKYPPREPGLMVGKNNFNITNLAKTYRHFTETWLEYGDNPKATVKYEDLLVDHTRHHFLSAFGSLAEYKRHNPAKWENPKAGSISQSKDYNLSRAQYYQTMETTILTKEHLDEVNRVIGEELFETLGYEMIYSVDSNRKAV